MKIHAFRVIQTGTISLDAVLTHIEQLPLEERLKAVGDSPLRIEQAVRAGDFWLIDFAGIKHEGPGRASVATPIEDFDLTEEEGFGHETAFCFNTQSSFLTLRYNHYGPRISRIQTYLYGFARSLSADPNSPNEGFAFSPVLKADAADRLNHMGIVKNIEISFYVPGVRAQQDGGGRQSLNSFLDNPLIGSAEKVRLQLSAGRARPSSIAVNHVKSMITDLLGVRDEVYDLKIIAQENEDAPKEPVDFIEARLEADIPVARVGRRYGLQERWAALRQAFNTWNANGQFA
jgi:hypothetical protein